MIQEHQRDDGHDIASLNGANLKSDAIAFTCAGEPLPMRGRFKGADALLILGGPSLKDCDLEALAVGRLTMAVNNAATVHRPALWMANDDPERFHDCIWLDPTIEKFVPAAHRNADLRVERDGKPMRSALRVTDAPNVRLYRRRCDFDPPTFLTTNALQIGCSATVPCSIGLQGVRSTMLSAIGLLAHFGVASIVLVGADFKMEAAKPYGFAEQRNRSEIVNNNAAYLIIAKRLAALRPTLEAAGTRILNASPNSQLDAFDRVPWETLLKRRPEPNTVGWYRHRTVAQ